MPATKSSRPFFSLIHATVSSICLSRFSMSFRRLSVIDIAMEMSRAVKLAAGTRHSLDEVLPKYYRRESWRVTTLVKYSVGHGGKPCPNNGSELSQAMLLPRGT